MGASENLKSRLKFSFDETKNLKSFKKYVENSIYAYEHDEGDYTLSDYKILLLLDSILEKVV